MKLTTFWKCFNCCRRWFKTSCQIKSIYNQWTNYRIHRTNPKLLSTKNRLKIPEVKILVKKQLLWNYRRWRFGRNLFLNIHLKTITTKRSSEFSERPCNYLLMHFFLAFLVLGDSQSDSLKVHDIALRTSTGFGSWLDQVFAICR